MSQSDSVRPFRVDVRIASVAACINAGPKNDTIFNAVSEMSVAQCRPRLENFYRALADGCSKRTDAETVDAIRSRRHQNAPPRNESHQQRHLHSHRIGNHHQRGFAPASSFCLGQKPTCETSCPGIERPRIHRAFEHRRFQIPVDGRLRTTVPIGDHRCVGYTPFGSK